MKVLHLANTPLSGSPYNLMMIQRSQGITSNLISHKNTYSDTSSVWFPYDVLLQDGRTNREKRSAPSWTPEQIDQLFFEADVLHLHNYLEDLYIFRLMPALKDYLRKKEIVLQFHSPRTSLKNANKDLKNRYVGRRLVVAQYQTRLFPECTPVPNAIWIDDPLCKPIERNNKKPIVVYSPSNTKLIGWNNKGYEETIRAINKVRHLIDFRLITNEPKESCLALKQVADISIDEVMTGSYHLCSLEALSQGQVAINNMDEHCRMSLIKVCRNYEGLGAVMQDADKTNLHDIIEMLATNPDMLRLKQKMARRWMETNWDPKRIADIYTAIYKYGSIKYENY